MILTVDDESKGMIATIQNGDRIEKYECIISGCENPVCTCETAYLDLIPTEVKDENKEQLPPRRVEIDITEKSLGFKNKKKIPKEDVKFAELFLSQLDENDFQVLYKSHFGFKNKISEEAPLDSIDAYFEYHEVEYNGLMYAYNDVLPYGDQLLVTINGKACILIDQYCLLPKCPCTDTNLSIFSVDKLGKSGTELCVASVNYKNKQWKIIEECSFPITLKTIRTAIEGQVPSMYKQLRRV